MHVNSCLLATVKLLQDTDHRDASTRTWLCNVRGGSGTVALKDLPRHRFISEIFACLVAQSLNLSVPTPHLVEVTLAQAQELQLINGLAGKNGATILYGSEFENVPALGELSCTELVQLCCSEPFAQVIVFDVLVGNADRARRNLLVDGTRLVPIDHDQVFHGLHWKPATLWLNASKISHSMLDVDLMYADDTVRQRMRTIAHDWKARISTAVSSIMLKFPNELALKDDERDAITHYLTIRAANLPGLLEETLQINSYMG